MKIHTFRITPGGDLKTEIETFGRREHVKTGFDELVVSVKQAA